MSNTLSGERCEKLANEVAEKFSGDPAGDIEVIYDFLENTEPEVKEYLTDELHNTEFKQRFAHTIFNADEFAFAGYIKGDEAVPYGEEFVSSIFSMYREYKENGPEDKDMKLLAQKAADLLLNGINGINNAK